MTAMTRHPVRASLSLHRLPLPRLARLLATTALTAPLWTLPALAQTLPSGASVAAGSVTIAQPSATQLNITQSSQGAVVNWQGFSIGAGHAVNIAQPNAASALLNRVTGDTPSTIAGSLNANGQVYLVNPNGIAITRSGTVNVGGGFVASTLDISDDDFMSGKRSFTGHGASAAVRNAGAIRIGRGGYAALIGGTVDNSGSIEVPLGKVALGSGERATLDFAGDGFLQVAAPTTSGGDKALIRHSGTIRADGGSVVISAATARDAARNAINLSGHVQARSISGRSGSIVIGGGAGGRVKVSGKLNVASRKGKGGKVAVTGRAIALQGAAIDASGKRGGGTVKVGGDWQGKGELQRAATTTIDAATTIRADATASGNGGTVVVWSDDNTAFAGTISARGGARGGDGGNAEVSGKALLAYTGFTDLSAAHGAFGTLLLDPYNVTIVAGSGGTVTGGAFTANADDSVLGADTLLAALDYANVTVSTGSGGSQPGDITVNADLGWYTSATLTLQAARDITLNSAITARAGGLALDAVGAITTGAGGAVEVARFSLQKGAWTQNTATLPGFAAGDFRLEGGSFLRASGGDGQSETTPWTLTDIYGVQGMATQLSGHFALAGDIDAAGTTWWWGGAGFVPIGNAATTFRGSFDGGGHVISGLTINRGLENNVGLFGMTYDAVITNIGVEGGTITGRQAVGGLLGYQQWGHVSQSWSSASVTGTHQYAGGLVGYQIGGDIAQSWASGSVSGNSYVGGLVGLQGGSSIAQSWASGSVKGSLYVGGLVGRQEDGSIAQSWASGAVAGTGDYVGGLVGWQEDGSIAQSWASGKVEGVIAGGLVGVQFGGSVTASYWDTETTGMGMQGVGGGPGGAFSATGLTTADARKASSYTGWDFANDWYQAGDMRPILRAFAAPDRDGDGVYEVSTMMQLQLMGADAASMAADYVLTRDLDASATNSTEESPGIWGAGGFVPVGHSGDSFTGSFDGGGHVISGLTVDRPSTDYVGLFGYTTGATIRNVGLEGVTVTGNFYVGGLVGVQSRGSIWQSWARGTVKGDFYVGGLVGGSSDGSIAQSWASGAVTSTGDQVGGLVGWQIGGGIEQSWASGKVEGSVDVGGLVGYSSAGSIAQSWASGAVTGDYYVGGLVGWQDIDGSIAQSWASAAVEGSIAGGLVGQQSGGSIAESWASGKVEGTGTGSLLGGLVGELVGGSVTASYWDTETTTQDSGFGSNPGGGAFAATGLTTAEARGGQTSIAYAGWDFDTVWYQAGDLRPILRASAGPTVDGVTQISTVMQLQLMGANLGRSYLLTSDLDASVADGADTAGIWGAGSFVPIGNGAAPFNGSFDGGGHVISGLTIARGSENYVGLFGYTQSATIRNVGLEGGSITGRSFVGGLVGWQTGGRIAQSWASGTVEGTTWVGGLVGLQSGGTIEHSWASGEVAGNDAIGGLVGYSNGGDIIQSWAGGTVKGTGDIVGGLVGAQVGDSSIVQSWAGSAVSGSSEVGGLVGAQVGGSIAQSWASGKVEGTGDDVGGLVGWQSGGSISQSWASGKVMGGTTTAGGLVGRQSGGGVTASYWDMDTTTQTAGIGRLDGGTFNATGLTTAQFQDTALFVADARRNGWNFETVWAPPAPGYYPEPYAMSKVVAVDPSHSRVYGEASTVARYYGLRPGEFLRSPATLSGLPDATANVGSYAVTASGGATTMTDPEAYRFVYLPGVVTVTPRPITVTALGGSSTYGDSPADHGLAADNLAAHDDIAALTGLFNSFGITATTGAGVHSLTVGGVLTNANYTLAGTVSGFWIVDPRPLTIAALAENKVYDGTTMAAIVALIADDPVSGDDLTLAAGTAVFDNKNVGMGKTVTVSGITLGGSDAGNYTFNATATTLADITPRALTIAANDASKIYDGTAWSGGNGVSYSGFASGETEAVLAGALIWGGTAQGARNAGDYTLTASGLTSGNYAISYVDGTLTIDPRPITVTADSLERLRGQANPPLTWTVGGMGLADGDTLSGLLATTATPADIAGTYPITQGTLAASANYAVTFVNGTLTVLPQVPDTAQLASSVVRDGLVPAILPDGAKPLLGTPPLRTADGLGLFYADPRFDSIYICFGKGTAQSCYSATSTN